MGQRCLATTWRDSRDGATSSPIAQTLLKATLRKALVLISMVVKASDTNGLLLLTRCFLVRNMCANFQPI
ncbi:hypothetical protein EYF80_051601 [Liparis tanakae]|uniref:Uncharacterized protein n=1 Tax=Liparis tanakae TaxID=230148 RepID=A0A4Z2FBS0_9TELE|nr:hypothetical protein EYF80_051601 [Liparis tanakae]